MVKNCMKIIFRDDDLNYDFDVNAFDYYEQIKDTVKVSMFCVPKIDFDWFNYLKVCERVGPGSNPNIIHEKMKWYDESRHCHENKTLLKYLSKNSKLGWISIGLHGSRHYQDTSKIILPNNYSFGAEYLLTNIGKKTIRDDVNILKKISDDIRWFAPPQNLISTSNFKKVAESGLNISCDLKLLRNYRILLGLKLKSIVKLIYWKLVKKIRFYYPFIVYYKNIKVLGVLRLNSQTNIDDLFEKICVLEKSGGEVVAINTHLSAFNLPSANNQMLGANLVDLVKRLKETGKFEFVTVNQL